MPKLGSQVPGRREEQSGREQRKKRAEEESSMTSGAPLVPSSTLSQKQTSDLGDPRGQLTGKQWESPGPSLVSC